MIHYTPSGQTQIEEFSSLYQLNLNPANRWIQLARLLPWDRMAAIYAQKVDPLVGAGAVSPREVIGTIIIKHKLCLTDEETLELISENPYMQVFLGLESFHPDPLFSPTLFPELRKRLGEAEFEAFNELIMRIAHPDLELLEERGQDAEGPQEEPEKPEKPNKGQLKIDATVADQYITYPNDLGLVNEARLNTEAIIDKLYEQLRGQLPVKPRTYRKTASQRYLAEAKKKKKTSASVRKALRYLLGCVERNLGHIEGMLDQLGGQAFPLPYKYQRQLWVIQAVAAQQRQMYATRTHRCPDRIVSLSQPHVRAIVRGKAGKKVEFGAKLGLSLTDGFLRADTLSWDAYNEAEDLKVQARAYKQLFGYYPELIQADKIYWTNANRSWCADKGIRLTATPKGPKVPLTAYQKRKRKKEYNERNHIEGRIGNAKQTYSLNQIKAKLRSTSESWIGATIFVLNLSTFAKYLGVTF